MKVGQKIEEKQNKLTEKLDEYLIKNPKAVQKIPKNSIIIPVDSTDLEFTEYSDKCLKKAFVENKKPIIAAYFTEKSLRFDRVLHFAY